MSKIPFPLNYSTIWGFLFISGNWGYLTWTLVIVQIGDREVLWFARPLGPEYLCPRLDDFPSVGHVAREFIDGFWCQVYHEELKEGPWVVDTSWVSGSFPHQRQKFVSYECVHPQYLYSKHHCCIPLGEAELGPRGIRLMGVVVILYQQHHEVRCITRN